jgi:hypothetical protein
MTNFYSTDPAASDAFREHERNRPLDGAALLTRDELIARLQARREQVNTFQPMLIVEYRGDYGIAMILGERLSSTWKSGDLIIFWDNGDQTDMGDGQRFNVFTDPLAQYRTKPGRSTTSPYPLHLQRMQGP